MLNLNAIKQVMHSYYVCIIHSNFLKGKEKNFEYLLVFKQTFFRHAMHLWTNHKGKRKYDLATLNTGSCAVKVNMVGFRQPQCVLYKWLVACVVPPANIN